MAFLYALPGAVAEGLIWGLMAIGVYILYKILDFADLTVDGSICTGACVCAVLIGSGVPVWLSMIISFFLVRWRAWSRDYSTPHWEFLQFWLVF